MTIEWSAFPSAGEIKVGAQVVGLTVADVNVRFDFPGTGIKDSSGAYLFRYFPAIGPAMNYVTFTSAETGDPAVISGTGGDVNVGLQLETQGDGNIFLKTSSGGIVYCSGTSATRLPTGTTAQRPTGNAGYIRYNSDGAKFEYYSTDTSDWQYFLTSAGVVLSLTGTANQIAVSSPTGNVTLSIPDPFIIGAMSCTSATVTTGNLTVSTGNIVVTTGTVTASSFIGTATVAATVTVINDNNNADHYLLFTDTGTGAQIVKTNAGIRANPSSDTITATTFAGNATSSTTSTLASTVTLANDIASATDYLVFGNGATGAQALKTNAGVTVNPSTGTITATTFSGTATLASTVTLANATANATHYLTFASSATGSQALKTNASIIFNPGTATLTATAISVDTLFSTDILQISGAINNVTDTTVSTSNSTGCFVLAGGLGISNATDATSATNGGTLTTAGGAAIAKKLYVGGPLICSAPPTIQVFSATSGTYNKNYTFVISSGSATIGATYTNNSITFTVYETVSASTTVVMRGSGAPLASGTLTKTSGTGDSTITFTNVWAPAYLKVQAVGGGGGGGGAGNDSATGGGNGTATTFGSVITANGGAGGAAENNSDSTAYGGAGGTVSSTLTRVWGIVGGGGGGGLSYAASSTAARGGGGQGGSSYFGAAAVGCATASPGSAGSAGGGGGSGGGVSNGDYTVGGCGGGAGGYVEGYITNPAATYAYVAGSGGSAGGIGTNGRAGGAGGSGVLIVTEFYY